MLVVFSVVSFRFSVKIGEAERQWNFSGQLLMSLRLTRNAGKDQLFDLGPWTLDFGLWTLDLS